jgi:neutral ceramidase
MKPLPSRSFSAPSLLLLAVLLSSSGCDFARIIREVSAGAEPGCPLDVDAYAVEQPGKKAHFSAGVATVDITPPPGFPTGGHGPEGSLPRGHWMRLRARAFFFEDRQGHTLALVSSDLFAVPGGLHARVAARISSEAKKRKLNVAFPPESLILAATHTHHSPSNYMTARTYNQFGSIYPGFSPPLFDFLTEQISEGVLAAIQDARAHPEPAQLKVHVSSVDYELVRNRSPRVFDLNQGREELLNALNGTQQAPNCTPRPGESRDEQGREDWNEVPGCPRLRATDRALTVLDVWRGAEGQRRRVGALVFFAAHPTVLDPGAPLYTPDFVGYAVHRLEREWGAGGVKPVVGFFNGAEGDITPRRTRRDVFDTYEHGLRFAEAINATVKTSELLDESEPTISVNATVVEPAEDEERSCRIGDGPKWTLAERPMLGTAALGGGEGDRTALYGVGWREGIVDRHREGQGQKLPALDSRLVRAIRLSDMIGPPEAFPQTLPLTRASLGGLTLAALPAELSTAQGQAIRDALQLPHGKLELIGLANDFHAYCATPDEYSAQDYMGASTIWGPQEGPFMTCHLQKLGGGAGWPKQRKTEDRRFWPGTDAMEAFGPTFAAEVPISRPDEGLYEVLLQPNKLPARRLPWFAWEEPSGMCGDALCPNAKRRVAIWQRTDAGWTELRLPAEGIEDDLGAGFVTVLLDSPNQRWAAIWLRPLLVPAPLEGTFAFVAYPKGGRARCSQPFSLGSKLAMQDEVKEGPCNAAGDRPL